MRIAVCTGQIPFARGGAELQTEALLAQLRLHGHEAELIQIPFRWYPKSEVLKGYLAWRLINLDESEGLPIDRVIALKFPGYVVRHPCKVTWLIQQFRQAYDLFGTEYSHFDNSPEDAELRRTIQQIDTTTLSESRRIFTNAGNTGKRLWLYNRLPSQPLYPPPHLDGRFYNAGHGDYIFTVCRLNRMKRVHLLVEAMGATRTPVRCKIAGRGEELENLRRLAARVGAAERVEFVGFVDDSQLLELYAHALAVYYAPVDEDYGLVTVEAMKSGKPVLTTDDSGGPTEFVESGVTGYMTRPGDTSSMAAHIDEFFEDRAKAERMGLAGSRKVSHIDWETTIRQLVEA